MKSNLNTNLNRPRGLEANREISPKRSFEIRDNRPEGIDEFSNPPFLIFQKRTATTKFHAFFPYSLLCFSAQLLLLLNHPGNMNLTTCPFGLRISLFGFFLWYLYSL